MTRRCGECSLCCRLLPVKELGKGAGERCRHQRGLGCKVYHSLRTVSPSCELWTCRWLVEDDTADLMRPDRSHYVIDVMPDFVRWVNNATGESHPVPTIQIWIDPTFPDAHHDLALRAYVERRAAEGMVALVRYGSGTDHDFTLIAPELAEDGQWHEVKRPPGVPVDPEHSAAEKVKALGRLRFVLGS
jgi:hypothetical protein